MVGTLGVTSTITAQLELAGRVALLRPTVLLPATAEPGAPGVGPQVVDRLLGEATTSGAGSVSVKATPVRAMPFGLFSVMVSRLVPPPCTTVGLNALLPVTAASELTDSVALAACVLRPCEVTNPPTGMVLIAEPAVAEVTSTLMLHWPGSMLGAGVAAGMAPLASARLVAPAVAVTLPPQPLTTLGTLATVMPGGRLSVSAAAVAGLLPVLSSVMVSVDTE